MTESPTHGAARVSPANLAAQARQRPAPPPAPVAEEVTGAQALVRSLEALGVDTVFGIPGGCILPAYDPLMDSDSVEAGTQFFEQRFFLLGRNRYVNAVGVEFSCLLFQLAKNLSE